ncbi:MAG: hypothetical protein RIR70_386 [Pseudomonadota bacterium]|jgi:soluble lytic murein transglycosylase-like protein
MRTFKHLIILSLLSTSAWAGGQRYEPLAASVQAALHSSIADMASPEPIFSSPAEREAWLGAMSARLAKYMPDTEGRMEFLKAVHYEATRAGLDPQLVLGLIQVESGFRKYAVSSVGARGYMQVMPFWVKSIGSKDNNLFHMRTNLRYGCTILRHYLDIEKGDLFRALGRYNGSLGQAKYPNAVYAAWKRNWEWNTRLAAR